MNRETAGGLAWASIAQFFVVEELTRRGWTPPYSRTTSFISDLGAVTCGTYDGREICSPHHVWINGSFVLVGVAIATGAVLVRSASPELVTPLVLVSYAAAGAGPVLTGLFPLDTAYGPHALGAGLFFVGASLGHVLLGQRLRQRGSRWYGTALAVVGGLGLIGSGLVAADAGVGLGLGLVERVVVYGANLGFIVTGLRLIKQQMYEATTLRSP